MSEACPLDIKVLSNCVQVYKKKLVASIFPYWLIWFAKKRINTSQIQTSDKKAPTKLLFPISNTIICTILYSRVGLFLVSKFNILHVIQAS